MYVCSTHTYIHLSTIRTFPKVQKATANLVDMRHHLIEYKLQNGPRTLFRPIPAPSLRVLYSVLRCCSACQKLLNSLYLSLRLCVVHGATARCCLPRECLVCALYTAKLRTELSFWIDRRAGYTDGGKFQFNVLFISFKQLNSSELEYILKHDVCYFFLNLYTIELL